MPLPSVSTAMSIRAGGVSNALKIQGWRGQRPAKTRWGRFPDRAPKK